MRENLLYGNENNIDDSLIINQLKSFHLEDISIDSLVSNINLSSGQMQKISFIRALLNNVEILFLDESTSNLDDTTKDQISKILNNLDITIVNSTHNPEDFYFTTKLKLKK